MNAMTENISLREELRQFRAMYKRNGLFPIRYFFNSIWDRVKRAFRQVKMWAIRMKVKIQERIHPSPPLEEITRPPSIVYRTDRSCPHCNNGTILTEIQVVPDIQGVVNPCTNWINADILCDNPKCSFNTDIDISIVVEAEIGKRLYKEIEDLAIIKESEVNGESC